VVVRVVPMILGEIQLPLYLRRDERNICEKKEVRETRVRKNIDVFNMTIL
jgi:hypothetical protein